jgi:PadR family transcriptional regulator PadR
VDDRGVGAHSYRLSPGTLYPLLESLEKRGYLVSRRERAGRTVRRLYRATPLGREVLAIERARARELFHELMEHQETAEPSA